MFAVEGAEHRVVNVGRKFLTFYLDNPTTPKIFSYPYPGASFTPWFYIQELSSRGTAFRFSFFCINELIVIFVYNSAIRFSAGSDSLLVMLNW